MKIFFDHQIFTLQKYGGISRYFFELFNHLNRMKDVEIWFPLVYSENEYIRNSSFYSNKFAIPAKKFPFRRALVKHLHRKNRKGSTVMMESQKFDVYHPTYYEPFLLNRSDGKPMVLTVYDMITEIFPEDFKSQENILEQKRIMAEKAARIIAISEHTKNDIMNVLGVPEKKIEVIHLATSLAHSDKPFDTHLPEHYLLYVGNRGKYKNFSTFIEATAPLLRTDPELFVMAAGSKPFSPGENAFLENLGVGPKVIHHPVYDDEVLAMLYSHAKAFVFPSLYEGFGIPVLEAFACHCPAIISYNSSLMEVGGNAVLYFDPKSPESIKNAVSKVMDDDRLRDDLIQKGRERLKQFSWEKTTKATHALYQELI
jgi:glycosyltransferase involved in cell wall biosynthesis